MKSFSFAKCISASYNLFLRDFFVYFCIVWSQSRQFFKFFLSEKYQWKKTFLGVLTLLLNEGITLHALVVPNFMLVTNSTVHWLILMGFVPLRKISCFFCCQKGSFHFSSLTPRHQSNQDYVSRLTQAHLFSLPCLPRMGRVTLTCNT